MKGVKRMGAMKERMLKSIDEACYKRGFINGVKSIERNLNEMAKHHDNAK